MNARDTSYGKQSRATNLMWDINSKRYRKRNMLERNEFSFNYTAFKGPMMV